MKNAFGSSPRPSWHNRIAIWLSSNAEKLGPAAAWKPETVTVWSGRRERSGFDFITGESLRFLRAFNPKPCPQLNIQTGLLPPMKRFG